MKRPYGITVFCDDVREEKLGKRIYIGVYNSELLIDGDFPAFLPTFAFVITYLEPLEDPIEPVIIKIFAPDLDGGSNILGEITLPDDRPQRPESQIPDGQSEYRAVIIPAKVGPLELQGPGYLKVRAYKGGEEIRLGALRVRKMTDEERPS